MCAIELGTVYFLETKVVQRNVELIFSGFVWFIRLPLKENGLAGCLFFFHVMRKIMTHDCWNDKQFLHTRGHETNSHVTKQNHSHEGTRDTPSTNEKIAYYCRKNTCRFSLGGRVAALSSAFGTTMWIFVALLRKYGRSEKYNIVVGLTLSVFGWCAISTKRSVYGK